MRLKLIARMTGTLVVALCLIACKNDDPADETSSEGDTGTSPAGALEASVETFETAGSVRMRFQLGGKVEEFHSETSGESGVLGQEVTYVNATAEFRMGEEKSETQMVFLPPDLYVHVPEEDGWYVISPWNQGVRPDELPDWSYEDPLLDYPAMVHKLRDVQQLPDEDLNGERQSRFIGATELSELPTIAGPDAQGDAEVAIWIAASSGLPRKVDLSSDMEDGARIEATFEFLDYGTTLTLPDRPADARPWRDLVFPDASCIGDAFDGCRARQDAIEPHGDSACKGSGRRVCLLPLGRVSPDLVGHLVDYYQSQYGLEVSVMTSQEVPEGMADPLREQIDVIELLDHMFVTFPEAHLDPEAVIIGLTPLDLYDKRSHFRYLFGIKGDYSDPKAVVSSMRMTPAFYGEHADQELFFARMRKLMSKYVGLLYYGLEASEDPESPMFDSILGPADLDRMTEPLPVP